MTATGFESRGVEGPIEDRVRVKGRDISSPGSSRTEDLIQQQQHSQFSVPRFVTFAPGLYATYRRFVVNPSGRTLTDGEVQEYPHRL